MKRIKLTDVAMAMDHPYEIRRISENLVRTPGFIALYTDDWPSLVTNAFILDLHRRTHECLAIRSEIRQL